VLDTLLGFLAVLALEFTQVSWRDEAAERGRERQPVRADLLGAVVHPLPHVETELIAEQHDVAYLALDAIPGRITRSR
jgi:hypothetical protein